MNKVTFDYFDKKNRYGRMYVNGQAIGIGLVFQGYDARNRQVYHYSVILANDFNMSNRIHFHARTIKGLMSKIERHKHTLVKP